MWLGFSVGLPFEIPPLRVLLIGSFVGCFRVASVLCHLGICGFPGSLALSLGGSVAYLLFQLWVGSGLLVLVQ